MLCLREAMHPCPPMNAGCGFSCTVHANSARDALAALVNAAIMAGENVGEGTVRAVFAGALDYVVHCDLDDGSAGSERDLPGGLQRQVTEVLAVVPSLRDDFSTEPLFVREGVGSPLRWTGALPPDADRLGRLLPAGVALEAVLAGRRSLL